ncbi:MAG: MFS transporter [Deltaproteobacteria bacterium]|nr:MFS transporter [Deltaproteobacteria bacterium]MBT4628985.1 MFS transporter [Deltaproteobacteria bacterium]MBT5834754.1 MFS transporter [Deltaproteobacteria bacterium]MBT7810200.1 MFS transporter [Deltaproteobacteria bacterium]
MKFSSIFQTNFPFSPSRFPFFYGWCIVIFTTIGMISSIPGQTMGVGVYTDFLIQNSHLTRMQISMAYMTGTILSSLLLPLAGRYYDLVGGRIMIVFAGIGMGISLLLFAESLTIIQLVHSLLPNISILTSELLVITVIFLLLRQFGQGIMAMVSRNTLAKWFERRRGMVSGISGIFVAFSFSGAPLFMNIIIEDHGYSGSMILMAIIFGFGMAFIGWLFFRDKPEDCGLLMDGVKITSLNTTNLFPEPEITLKEALRTYNFWIFCLGLCSASLIVTGLTFHISSIGALAGLSRIEAYGLFLPMSVISVLSHFIAGWASDRMPLKYLLMILLAGLALGSLGILNLESFWFRLMLIIGFGVQGGIWGCLTLVAWPRFYGRKHLGAISGAFMGAQVFASAIGPPVFGLSESLNGDYYSAAWISVALNLLLLLGTVRAVSYYRPLP